MMETIWPEIVRFGVHFRQQLDNLWFFWLLGIGLGSAVSVFGKDRIHRLFSAFQGGRLGILGLVPASLIGLASPLCMYGTIPVAASFARQGVREDWLAAFMMSSILLNPQLLIYSAALGPTALLIRLLCCFAGGLAAGLGVRFGCRGRNFFNFAGFSEPDSRDIDRNLFLRLIKNMGRNLRATGPYFLLGIALAALFQSYVSPAGFARLFGEHSGAGVFMAATIGVPVYVCGGGTIPLLHSWLQSGMGLGAAAAFMITGPATKITNLGAVKIVLGFRRFIVYIGFSIILALICGLAVNLLL